MDKPQFVYVTLIATTPEKLWAALTSAEFTDQYWFGTKLESDWQVGSSVVFRRDGQITDEGKVLKSEPPRLLSFTFHHVADEALRSESPSLVTFEIEPADQKPGFQGNAVRLTLTHGGFDEGSKLYPRISGGWPVILSNLKTLLETNRPLDLSKKACG